MSSRITSVGTEEVAAGSYRRMMSLPKTSKAHLEVLRKRQGLSTDTKAVASALETRAKIADLSDDEIVFAAALWKTLRNERKSGEFRLLVEPTPPTEILSNQPPRQIVVPGLILTPSSPTTNLAPHIGAMLASASAWDVAACARDRRFNVSSRGALWSSVKSIA